MSRGVLLITVLSSRSGWVARLETANHRLPLGEITVTSAGHFCGKSEAGAATQPEATLICAVKRLAELEIGIAARDITVNTGGKR